jgi:hypothetical protein
MLLDVSRLVALIEWPFIFGQLLRLTACFPLDWIAGHGGGVLACELQFEECGVKRRCRYWSFVLRDEKKLCVRNNQRKAIFFYRFQQETRWRV